MSKSKKIFLFLLFFSLISCKNNIVNKVLDKKTKQTDKIEKNKADSVNQNIEKIVRKWNSATSNKDITALESILADKIEYYQQTVTKAEYISDKKKFFEKNNIYGQEIKGDIEYKILSERQVKVDFLKEVTTKNGTNDYPSYLIFENIKKKKSVSKNTNYEKNLIAKMKPVDEELDDMLSYSQSTADMTAAINYASGAWDTELNIIYKLLMKKLSKEEQISLRDKQRNWIKMRDSKINEAAAEFEGGSMGRVTGGSVFLEETKKRTLELSRIYDSL